MEVKLFLGIDPGISGCVAAINSSGRYVGFFDIPTIEKPGVSKKKETKAKVKRKVDGKELYNQLLSLTDIEPSECLLVLEGQVAMSPPKKKGEEQRSMGASSLMSLGHTYGAIEAAVQIAGMRYEIVYPRKWKNKYKIPGEKDGGKKYALSIARMLFPKAPLNLQRHHNRAEALLLAKYAFDVYSEDL